MKLPDSQTSAATIPRLRIQRNHVYVKELSERDRHRVLRHFQGLEADDRLLRFGTYLPDEIIEKYVAGLDFSRDKVFGVVSSHFRLVGVGHLAFAPRKESDNNSDKDEVAEFGVSVSGSARGKGIGSALFERGAIHCRNANVDTLYMHCLASNQTMCTLPKKPAWRSCVITAKRTPICALSLLTW